MTFFNKKEDVLDIQLTQLGKYLLSKGKLKPVFYAFSDDEVLYDTRYVSGTAEDNRESSDRIQKDTQRLKTLYEHDGVESRILSLNGHSVEKARGHGWQARVRGRTEEMPLDQVYGVDTIEQEKMGSDDRNLFRNFLGNSTIGERSAPSWQVDSLHGGQITKVNISSSSPNVGIKRPVINFEIEYEINGRPIVASDQNPSDYGSENELAQHFGAVLNFSDGYEAEIIEKKLVLSFIEENVDFDLENFEFEMYEVEGVHVNQNANNATVETLKKLYFAETSQEFENPNYIQYYFDIVTDNDVGDLYGVELFGTNPQRIKEKLRTVINTVDFDDVTEFPTFGPGESDGECE